MDDLIFVCAGAASIGTNLDGSQSPTCEAGQGRFATAAELMTAEPFDPASLNPADIYSAFGAGFIVMGTGLVLAMGVRFVVNMVKEA